MSDRLVHLKLIVEHHQDKRKGDMVSACLLCLPWDWDVINGRLWDKSFNPSTPSNWLREKGARKYGLWINRCRERTQRRIVIISPSNPPFSPHNQHHHRRCGRIRVDTWWNCDRIIFLSERGRNNWTHRPPSDTSICRPANYGFGKCEKNF